MAKLKHQNPLPLPAKKKKKTCTCSNVGTAGTMLVYHIYLVDTYPGRWNKKEFGRRLVPVFCSSRYPPPRSSGALALFSFLSTSNCICFMSAGTSPLLAWDMMWVGNFFEALELRQSGPLPFLACMIAGYSIGGLEIPCLTIIKLSLNATPASSIVCVVFDSRCLRVPPM